MMTRRTFSLAALAATATSILTPAAAQQSSDLFHIDDLSGAPGSSYGGRWQLSTDRVMGGVSRGSARLIQENGQNIIEMTGDVSTANNGGFVQVSKSLRPRLDASDYTGVELVVQGDGHPYWLHLRDRNTPWPWQVYNASYETSGEWELVRVPFSQFRPYHKTRRQLDPSSLNGIGLVAGYDDFQAKLKIARVSLYR